MKVIGIVTEYNPFHNGHIYQLEKIKEMYPESIIIIAMSGNYTERGEISLINKWDKTKIAIQHGVDIVLEIPFIFSNQSADNFSYAAIKMLECFKIDTLIFGSESNNKEKLIKAASIQLNNKDFDGVVKKHMNNGENYPTSLNMAIKELGGINITESNDLLAVSYIKEILRNNYKIDIEPIKRTNSFLDTNSENNIVSAFNIRNKLRNNIDVSKYLPKDSLEKIKLYDEDKLFNLLKYKIISEKEELYKYHLVTEGIHNRIYESLIISHNYEDLVENIKSKRFTYNKVNRILINILVGFTKSEANKFRTLEYIRILGMSNNGRNHYSSIKKDIDIPVITKFEKINSLQIELRASMIYSIITDTNMLEIKGKPYFD